jgi:hypothetical protein
MFEDTEPIAARVPLFDISPLGLKSQSLFTDCLFAGGHSASSSEDNRRRLSLGCAVMVGVVSLPVDCTMEGVA